MDIVPVILSGGAGTRLWPLSRELYPKQLLPLVGEQTMLQETLLRLEGLSDMLAPLVVCNDAHRFLVAEQLRAIGQVPQSIVLEPVGRNTAPAVAVAALQATCDGGDPLLLVLPADHVIRDAAALRQAIVTGIGPASQGALLTFGIVPTAPETGYGYIRAGSPLECNLSPECTGTSAECKVLSAEYSKTTPDPSERDSGLSTQDSALSPDHSGLSTQDSALNVYSVAEFVEKPNLATAECYVQSGDYYWNSGMFLFQASVFLAELGRHAPLMLAACRRAWAGRVADLDFTRLDAAAFAACPADSIDYAVMEKTARAAVIPLSAGWSDVGSWSALWEVGEGCDAGNVCHGDIIDIDVERSYLYASSRLVAAIGVSDLVVVETADAVLVAAKERVQEVKRVVEHLKAMGRSEHLLHRRVNRPWGTYEGLDAGDGFLVKRITVNPGASLSLQRHRQRAEHWVVVHGTARIVCGEETLIRTANQSLYIPIGAIHRLENPGETLLEIIEVQTGDYLGEDDIERFEDKYGR